MKFTENHRYKNLIRFKQQNGSNLWLVFGGTSAWPNEAEPPAASKYTTSVAEAFCAQKADVTWLVEDSDAGTILFKDANQVTRKFRAITTAEDVLSEQATLCLIYAEVAGSLFAVPTWRIIGYYTDLVPVEGYESETFLTAGQVDDWGTLELIENRIRYDVVEVSTYIHRQVIKF